MVTDTIQNALKRLFCSIGGNADNVRNKDDINVILDEMTALNIGEKISSAGTTVVANPTLAGTEDSLTGLEIDGTKYKVGGGSSGGGVLVVHIDEEYSALDKTWQEIHDALAQGTPCVTLYNEDDDATQGVISSATKSGPPGSEIYLIRVLVALGTDAAVERWQASSADGYPAYMSE